MTASRPKDGSDLPRRLLTLDEMRAGEAQAALAFVLGVLEGRGPDKPLGKELHEQLRMRLRNALDGVLTQLGGAPLTPKIVGIDEIVREHPDLRLVMKSYDRAGFAEVGVAITTWPERTDVPEVVGLFFVDRKEALKTKSSKRIKQDFVVYWGTNERPWYCGGLPRGARVDKTRKTIHEFCKRFAKGKVGGPYGCYLNGTKWRSSNHHYSDENDPNLPVEPEIRDAIGSTLRAVQADGLRRRRS